MIDGMRYIGIGEYGVFEGDLKELMEARVIVTAANELGLFDGVDFGDALAELYAGLGETPYDVADSLVASIE
nr:MAG TPA: hypothetical protein [Caudoviricetes sp.]